VNPSKDEAAQREDQAAVVAARLRLTPSSEVRVLAQTLNGTRLVHIREFVLTSDNEYVPTPKGVAFSVGKLGQALDLVGELRAAGPEDASYGAIQVARGGEIRFGISSWKGNTKADIRLYFHDSAKKEHNPTRKGIRMPLSLLADLERGLEALDRHETADGRNC
jgi:hypothetical protein